MRFCTPGWYGVRSAIQVSVSACVSLSLYSPVSTPSLADFSLSLALSLSLPLPFSLSLSLCLSRSPPCLPLCFSLTETSNIEMTCSTCRILRRDLLLRRLRRPLLLHIKKKPATLSDVPRRQGMKKSLIATTWWMGSRTQQRP